ncbi:hypothetical protein HVA01_08630 [Halovibrio variabilis]|uniref:Uncharacterized protein n=1 Tax=Halovibrio variabilis TaxID=31910 RepID=A0A511UKT9_9GAMM|nr:hypothetical protein [Halovibrio variabilis]GEN27217.1 hypothetical protein HVA01_08630 [Halovibrio variabilis]
MDTRESKTREEEKQHLLDERVPEDFDASQPHLQPEAKQKPPNRLHQVIPLVVVAVGIIVAGLLILGIGGSGG